MKTFVVLFAINVVLGSVKETDKDCGGDETCFKTNDCPSFLKKHERYKSLSVGLEQTNLKRQLKEAVCNKKERAFCCPNGNVKETDKVCGRDEICRKMENCDSFLEKHKRFKSLSGGSEHTNLKRQLKEGVCNKKERGVCCQNEDTPVDTRTDNSETSRPNYLPRLGSCGLRQDRAGNVRLFSFNTTRS